MPDIEDLRERARKRAVDGYGEMDTSELEAALGLPVTVAPEPEEPEAPEEPPVEEEDLEALTIIDLRARAREAGVPRAREMNKAELVDALRADAATPPLSEFETPPADPDDDDSEAG